MGEKVNFSSTARHLQMLTEWLKKQLYSRKILQEMNIFTGQCYRWTALVNLLTLSGEF